MGKVACYAATPFSRDSMIDSHFFRSIEKLLLVVESMRDSRQTTLEGTEYDGRAIPPASAFSIEAIQQRLLRKQ